MTDLTKDKIKAILVTLLVILVDICGIIGMVILFTHALPEVVTISGTFLLLFLMFIWTWIAWVGWSSSNPFKKK